MLDIFSGANSLIKEKNNRIFLILVYHVYFATFSALFFILVSFPHLTHTHIISANLRKSITEWENVSLSHSGPHSLGEILEFKGTSWTGWSTVTSPTCLGLHKVPRPGEVQALSWEWCGSALGPGHEKWGSPCREQHWMCSAPVHGADGWVCLPGCEILTKSQAVQLTLNTAQPVLQSLHLFIVLDLKFPYFTAPGWSKVLFSVVPWGGCRKGSLESCKVRVGKEKVAHRFYHHL